MEEKIKKIMADLFFIDIKSINENSSPDNIVQWDSLAQLNLATSIEEEFEIELTSDQISDMLNFKLVVVVVEEAIQSKNL